MKYRWHFLAVALLVAGLPAWSQTTASCTFSTFNPPSGGYSWPSPNGINNYSTEVGAVLSPPINTVARWRGLTRYSGGSMTVYNFPNAQDTWFTKRNDAGVTVGYWDSSQPNFHGIVKNGTQVTQVDYPLGSDRNTWLYGINKWGTIVGQYVTFVNGNFTTGGFKLQSGHFSSIMYPKSTFTRPLAINSNGVIVGTYSNTASGNPYPVYQGFILQNGTYKTINNSLGNGKQGTQLADINDSGVMVGNWIALNPQNIELPNGFIYKNGVFEAVKYPGASGTAVYGINNSGTIVGTARMPANNGFGYNLVPYKANCK